MEEFNFFGAKGKLTSVQDMITKEVSKKLTQEKERQEQDAETEKLSKEIEKNQKALHAKSKDMKTIEKQSQENLNLAMELFRQRRETQQQNEKLQKEVVSLRQYIVKNGLNLDGATNEDNMGTGESGSSKNDEGESI